MKRKFYLSLSLLLGGFITLGNLTSCAEILEHSYSITTKVNIEEGGKVETDKTQGRVGETINVKITINEGYAIDKVIVNESERPNKDVVFSFETIQGINIIDVRFKKLNGDQTSEEFTLNLKYDNSKGLVSADKLNGYVGDKVHLTITPNAGYEVESISFNGLKVSNDQREFEITQKENTISVTFKETGTTPEKEDYSLELIFNKGEGSVESNVTSGKEGDKITLTINPANGYEVFSITHNGSSVDKTTRDFIMKAGKNTIEVAFKKVETPKDEWTLKIISTENGGTVTNKGKNEGFVGENFEVEIIPAPEFIIDKILFNGNEVSKDDRIFTPIKGENTLEVVFVRETLSPSIDDGFSIDLIYGNYESNFEFASQTEFIKEFVDLLVKYDEQHLINIPDKNYVCGLYEQVFNKNPKIYQNFVKAGVSKAKLNELVEISIKEFFPAISQSGPDNNMLQMITKIYEPLKKLVSKVTLEEFYAVGYAFTSFMVFEGAYYTEPFISNDFKQISDINNLDYFAKAMEGHEEVQNYINSLSHFDYNPNEEISNFFTEENEKCLKVLAEFVYKLVKKLSILIPDGESLYKHMLNYQAFMSMQINETNAEACLETVHLIGELLSDNFVNKEGFSKLIDSSDTILEIVNTTVNFDTRTVLTLDNPRIFGENIEKSDDLYYGLKYIANIIKDITKDELLFIVGLITGNTEQSGIAKTCVTLSKRIIGTYNSFGEEALLIKNGLTNGIKQIQNLINNGMSNPSIISNAHNLIGLYTLFKGKVEFGFNVDDVFSVVDEASKKDPNLVTPSDDQYYQQIIQDKIQSKIKFTPTNDYRLVVKNEFDVDEALNIELYKNDINGGEPTKIEIPAENISGFDSSKIGFGRLKVKIPETNYTYTSIYRVGMNDEWLNVTYEDKWSDSNLFPINANLDEIKFLRQNGKEQEVVATGKDLIGVDFTKEGKQLAAVKLGDNYYFSKVVIYDESKVSEFNVLDNLSNLPLNVEHSIKKNEFISISGIKEVMVDDIKYVLSSNNRIVGRFVGFGSDLSSSIKFTTPGQQKALITLDIDGEIVEKEIVINVFEPKNISTNISTDTYSPQYYNFLNSTKFPDKVFDFRLYTNFNDGNYYYSTDEIVSLTSNDFKYKLEGTNFVDKNTVKDFYTKNNVTYEFQYYLYELKEEFIDKEILSYQYNPISFIKGMDISEYNDSFNILKVNGYIYVNQFGYIAKNYDYQSEDLKVKKVDNFDPNLKSGLPHVAKVTCTNDGNSEITKDVTYYLGDVISEKYEADFFFNLSSLDDDTVITVTRNIEYEDSINEGGDKSYFFDYSTDVSFTFGEIKKYLDLTPDGISKQIIVNIKGVDVLINYGFKE